MTNEEAINVLRGQESAYWDTLTEAEHKAFDLAVDALELLKAQEPRVLTLEELMSSSGGGFVEIWFEGDPEEGLKEEKVLIECGWCRGCYVTGDGDFSNEDYIAGQYNKRYGLRIWTGRPTDEQREAVMWDDEG